MNDAMLIVVFVALLAITFMVAEIAVWWLK
jgi:hypothetical protein